MIFSQISCAGKDIQEVWLGGRLVWQYSKDLALYGDADISLYTTALFSLPIQYVVKGGGTSKTISDAPVKIVAIDLLNGDAKSVLHTKSAAQLMESLLMATETKSVTFSASNGRKMLVKLIAAKDEFKSVTDGNVIKALTRNAIAKEEESTLADSLVRGIRVRNGIGKENESTHTKIPARVIKVKNFESDIELKSLTGVPAVAIYVIEAKAGEKIAFRVSRSTALAMVESKMVSLGKSITYYDTTQRSNPAQQTDGESYIRTIGLAIGDTYDSEIMDGDAKTFSGSLVIAELNDAMLMKGIDGVTSDGDGGVRKHKAQLVKVTEEVTSTSGGNINKYDVLFCKVKEETASAASGGLIIWFPPVGDGEPLVEEDGVDITKNGEVLEIRQAFRVIKHDNGILEVI